MAALLEGIFERSGGERMRVVRPPGVGYPIEVRAQWLTDGTGRIEQNKMLSAVSVMEVDHLAAAVAKREAFVLPELKELALRPEWRLAPVAADRYAIEGGDDGVSVEAPRRDLLLAVELMIRAAVLPFAGETAPPPWVPRARTAHHLLLAELDGEPLFTPLDGEA